MIKSYRIILLLFLFICITPNICLGQNTNHKTNKDTIIIKGDAYFPPYEFIDKNGKPTGFNVSIIESIMEELGQPYKIELGIWSNAIKDLDCGKADLITSMIYTKERAKKYSYGINHSTINYSLVIRKDSKIKKLEELENKNIAIQENESIIQVFNIFQIIPNITYTNSTLSALELLDKKSVDAIICSRINAQYLIKENKLNNLKVIDSQIFPMEYCIVGKDEYILGKLNQAYYKLKYAGKIKEIKDEWFKYEPTISEMYHYLFICAILIIALFFFIYFLWEKVKLTRSSLSINLKKYFTLFQNTPIGLEYYNNNGIITDINTSGSLLFGILDKKKYLDSKVSIYDNPILGKLIKRDNEIKPFVGIIEFNLLEQEKDPFFKLYTKNKVLFLQTRIFPIIDSKGNLQTIICSYTDITTSIIANRKERNTRENLALALEAGNIRAWIYDVNKEIINSISTNNKSAKLTYSLEKIIRHIHPNDKNKFEDIIKLLLSKEKYRADAVLRFKGENNKYNFYEFKFVSKVIKGEIVSIAATQKDITLRLNNQKTLEEYITKMRFAIKATDSVFFEFNTIDKSFKSYNESLNNYDDTVLIDKDEYINITHQEDRIKITDYINCMLEGNTIPDNIIIRQKIGPNTDWDYISFTCTQFKKKNNKIIKYVGFRRNLTTHIMHQKRLEEYKTKMNLAIDSSGVIIWDYDLTNDLISRNSGEELENKKLEDFYKLFGVYNPDVQRAYNIMKSGKNESFKFETKYKDDITDSWNYITLGGIPFAVNKDGKCIKYTGYILNTTKWNLLTKKIEDSSLILDTIIDNLPSALYIKDLQNESRYITANKMCTVFTNKLKEEIIGKTDEEISGKKYASYYSESDKIAIKKGIYTFQEKSIEDVEERMFQTTKSIITTNSGQKLLIGIKTDITSLNKTLIELNEEKEKALRADKLKSAFLANMSHEIRTPLNSIIGFSELLQSTDNDDDKDLYVNIIKQNNEILLRLINDILDLSKIESGYMDLKPTEFNLCSLIEDTYTSSKQHNINDNIIIELINPYKKCIVYLDKNRITQILNNFISNAIKYTKKGCITISYQYINEGIEIKVQDTGIGISENKLQRVFGRFEKLDDFAQGTGLGLAICKAIVDRKGGKIGVESKEGEGSIFWAWIPCNAIIEK